MRWRNESGIPGEANKPVKPSIVSDLKPASAAVGISGKLAARCGLVSAKYLDFAG